MQEKSYFRFKLPAFLAFCITRSFKTRAAPGRHVRYARARVGEINGLKYLGDGALMFLD